MTLIRWTPTRTTPAVVTLHDEVNRLLDSIWDRPASVAAAMAPAVDVHETKDAYVFRADVPGFDQKDLKVTLQDDVLSIRGERRRDAAASQGTVHRSERAFGAFERTFTLPQPVQSDDVKASYRDGVLEVTVPKSAQAQPREIEVRVG